eukprot:2749012-Rhodomonas_salina.1
METISIAIRDVAASSANDVRTPTKIMAPPANQRPSLGLDLLELSVWEHTYLHAHTLYLSARTLSTDTQQD